MSTMEFQNLLVKKLNDRGIKERSLSSETEMFYYDNDYSAINMIHNGMMFNILGHKTWIRIPCHSPNYEDFFAEIFVRDYDKLEFRSNPDTDVNTVVIDLLFINSNSSQGWHTIGVYGFNSKNVKKSNNDFIEYINDAEYSDGIHYEPSEGLIDVIIKIIENIDTFLNNDEKLYDSFNLVRKEETSKKKQKCFKDNLKESVKEIFGSDFKI